MVDTYTIHRYEDVWECGDGCCTEYDEYYTVEYKDFFDFPKFQTKEEALMFILERESILVVEGEYD